MGFPLETEPDGGLRFSVKHWYLWQSAEVPAGRRWPGGEVLPCNGGGADVGFLPMMQRRRLSPLARAACAVAWHGRQAAGDMPTVFFSRHGESQYYLEMLQDMAAGEPVSPSRFSLCVHNAIGGLFSFQTESFLPYVSLAGGTEDLFAAFIEAGGQLQEVPQVMVVCYEQSLPTAYQGYVSSPPLTWALALVLGRSGESGYGLKLTRTSCGNGASAGQQMPALVQAILNGQRNGEADLERSVWRWRLDDV